MSVLLLRELEAHGHAISQKILDEMYVDPFWIKRFGAKGRRHADEDSDFHMRYLKRALESNDQGLMPRYATWLRDVLVSRGMCTHHLAENFERLARAIAERGWADHEEALALLDGAVESLRYPGGVEAAIQQRSGKLAEAWEKRLRARGADPRQGLARGPGAFQVDAAHLLSYLADARAHANPQLLVSHVRWLARELPGAGGVDGLRFALDTLAEVLREDAEVAAAADYVDSALISLASAVEVSR